jgi:uncharacterized protein (TIGR04222 family)
MKSHLMLSQLIVPNAHNALVLGLYIALLIAVIIFAVRYRKRAMERMERPNGNAPHMSLDELAFLAGGAQRMMQLATFRLFECQLLTCETRWMQQKFVPVECHDFESKRLTKLEQNLYTVSCAKKKLVGMDDNKFRMYVSPMIEQIETKLAIAGYRPKQSERTSMIFTTMLPFLLLIALGVARILYGLSHDYPVLYLVILVIITFIVGLMVSNATAKLTKKGISLLEQQKQQLDSSMVRAGSAAERNEFAGLAVALSGAAGLVAFTEYKHLQSALQSLNGSGGGDASSGGGCGSSGCGSSGCGSSGCGGGCGGGGD